MEHLRPTFAQLTGVTIKSAYLATTNGKFGFAIEADDGRRFFLDANEDRQGGVDLDLYEADPADVINPE